MNIIHQHYTHKTYCYNTFGFVHKLPPKHYSIIVIHTQQIEIRCYAKIYERNLPLNCSFFLDYLCGI